MTSPSDSEKRARASRAVDSALECERLGKRDEAIREYERACELDPSSHIAAYNLGLLYKYAGNWERSLEFNARAAALEPNDAATRWNLGIAATALGRWELARTSWRAAGIDVPAGDGPVAFACGRTPIRLNAETAPEVVWADRIDPARALLVSIPLPDSGFRYGDVVLNDGAPVGYRKSGQTELPVLNCLARLETSPFGTWLVHVREQTDTGDDARASIETLCALAAERGLAAEDWSTSLRILCRACSEGRPHAQHDEQLRPEREGTHRLAIAARSAEEAESLLAAWQACGPGLALGPLRSGEAERTG